MWGEQRNQPSKEYNLHETRHLGHLANQENSTNQDIRLINPQIVRLQPYLLLVKLAIIISGMCNIYLI